MKEEIQFLIDSYRQKIRNIDSMMEDVSIQDTWKMARLTTKRGCYQSILTELERLTKIENDERIEKLT